MMLPQVPPEGACKAEACGGLILARYLGCRCGTMCLLLLQRSGASEPAWCLCCWTR